MGHCDSEGVKVGPGVDQISHKKFSLNTYFCFCNFLGTRPLK